MKDLHLLGLPQDREHRLTKIAALHQKGRGPLLRVLAVAKLRERADLPVVLIGAGRRPESPHSHEDLADKAFRTIVDELPEFVVHIAAFDTDAKKIKHLLTHDRRHVWRVDQGRPNSPPEPYALEIIPGDHFELFGLGYALKPVTHDLDPQRVKDAERWLESGVIRRVLPEPALP